MTDDHTTSTRRRFVTAAAATGIAFVSAAGAQDGGGPAPLSQVVEPIDVFVLRHAEKGGGDPQDPELSEAGTARAHALARFLGAAGVTHLTIDTLNSSLALIKDGRVRPLAVTTMRRSAISPELPTLNETAFPGMEMSAWQGIVVPAGTPPAIIEKLNAEVRKALKHPEVVEKLAAQGTDILGSTPQEYANYIRSELQRWSRLIRETGAKVD